MVEIALIGACEDQPPVAVLEHVDIVGLEQAPDDDLADLGRDPAARRRAGAGWFRPPSRSRPPGGGPARRARGDYPPVAAVDRHQPPELRPVGRERRRAPVRISAPRAAASTAFEDHKAAKSSTTQSEYSKRSAERAASARLPIGWWVTSERWREAGRPGREGEPVVEAGARERNNHGGRSPGMRWGWQTRIGSHQMRRDLEPVVTLGKGRARTRKEPPALQRGEIAMDHARGVAEDAAAREIALLQQDHPSSHGRRPSRAMLTPFNPPADDRQIVVRHARLPV